MTTAAMPPVGPLASTENLLPGDILRVVSNLGCPDPAHLKVGANVTVEAITLSPRGIRLTGFDLTYYHNRFDFVARPGVWMPCPGGGNPVPGMKVVARMRDGREFEPADICEWDNTKRHAPLQITEYMVISDAAQPVQSDAAPSAPVRGDPVEPPFGSRESLSSENPAKIEISPHSVQDGDRIRFVIEGVVGNGPGDWGGFTRDFIQKAADRFGDRVNIELLERPEKPLAVGDRVTSDDASRITNGEILCICNDQAWVKEYDGLATTVLLRNLTRA